MLPTLEASTLIILFSEMMEVFYLKFKWQKFEKENIESSEKILFVEMEISKLINY
jgi:hypothetical protein